MNSCLNNEKCEINVDSDSNYCDGDIGRSGSGGSGGGGGCDGGNSSNSGECVLRVCI